MNMKRLIIIVTTISIFLIFFVSCYYDNEEALYPTLSTSCDTTNVTYSGTIAPIMNSNCVGCHSGSSAGGSILLTNYTEVVAHASRITGSIKQLSSYSPMPKNGGKLKDCSITQWDIWVRKGMLNN
jgi:hypothetical protein